MPLEMDLNAFEIYLRNQDGPLPAQAVRSNALNGMFYTELGLRYSHWVDEMHRSNGNLPRPFSLALIHQDGAVHGFRIGTLNRETGERVGEVWSSLAARRAVVRLGSARMEVLNVGMGSPGATDYTLLWENAPCLSGIRLRFLSPIRLKINGNDTVLPTPRAVWQSYANRWEAYAGIPLPPEFVRWVDFQVQAQELNLNTFFAYEEKNVEWKGVVGEVAYQAFPGAHNLPASRLPDYVRSWHALAALAEYSGTGEKVTRGMGRTQKVKVFGPMIMDEEEGENELNLAHRF